MAFSHTYTSMVGLLDNSTGILKDNAAGDISATDLRDAIATALGGGFPDTTHKNASFSAVVGSVYGIDLAAASADIEITFPTSPTKGDIFGFYVAVQDATLVFNVDFVAGPTNINAAAYTGAAGGKWSLWLNGEYLLFKYIDATLGWLVVADGRIPHVGVMNLTTAADGEAAITITQPTNCSTAGVWTVATDNAGLADITEDRWVVKRAGIYAFTVNARAKDAPTSGTSWAVFTYVGAVVYGYYQLILPSTTNLFWAGGTTIASLAVGEAPQVKFRSQEGGKGMDTNFNFFAIQEIKT